MSRGRSSFRARLAFVGLAALFTWAGVAAAALTKTASPVAGTDDRAPSPVTNLQVEANLVDFQAAISWEASADDFTRPSPVSSDFTSGGTFVNVNDVAGYNIWRRSALGGDFEQIASVGSGETSYVDDTVESGVIYVYAVTAVDAAGNESESVESGEVTFGPPGKAKPELPPQAAPIARAVTLILDNDLDVNDKPAVDAFLADLKNLLADLLGININRIVITGVHSGSVIVDFQITETTGDPAADVVARLNDAVKEDPAVFADAGLGALLEYQAAAKTSIDFGEVEADAEAVEEIGFTNTSTDPDAVLIVSAAVEGEGFFAFPDKLTLRSGESGAIEVSFAAADVANVNGAHTGTLTVITNDPNNRLMSVALSATVVGGVSGPILDLSTTDIKFVKVAVGSSSISSLTISNKGGLPLQVTLSLEGDDAFSVSEEGTRTYDPGESAEIEITFAPAAEGAFSATLLVTSSDPARPEVAVALSGSGIPPGGPPILIGPNGEEIFGDFDGSAKVDFDDFFLFADNFGLDSSNPNFDSAFDLDNSGKVDFDDFFIFADNFGLSGTYQTVGGATVDLAALLDEDQAGGTGSTASGIATLQLNGTNLTYSITVVGLADLSVAHIHKAPAGQSGAPVHTLSFVEVTPAGETVRSWEATGEWDMTAEEVDDLMAGDLYVNVHSTAFPAGEVRGQIEEGLTFSAFIEESQANAGAGTGSAATGDGFFTYSDEAGLSYHITVRGLSAISQAHIHNAPAGENGGVVHPLTFTQMGTGVWVAAGTWDTAGGLTPALVDELKATNLYANVHTAAFPAGEIRGQIE